MRQILLCCRKMIFSAQSVLFLTISTGVIPPAIPSRPKPFECLDGRIVPINTNRHTAGLLQTSGFPHRLKLPLKCAWLIDNSARDARQSKNYLHLYFTQVCSRTVNIHPSMDIFLAFSFLFHLYILDRTISLLSHFRSHLTAKGTVGEGKKIPSLP